MTKIYIILTKVLKMIKHIIYNVNKIFETGNYPDAWSKGIIVPIHKKGIRVIPQIIEA